ncbi:glycine betaine ABC transporter substrate-binding protein [Salinibacterium sp. ZJ454]|uniref:glycine betaine ABC transporter substrate-binding protein n=1 Tax=Salinibacterium sp. ZJ454 TaxID=2708339 RepID=UPI003265A691
MLVAGAAVVGLVFAACAGGGAGTATATHENGDKSDVTIAVFNGWDENVAVSELWKAVLEEKGYDVTLEYADPAPAFTGLASGDYDVNMDVWLPTTHKEYIKEYGDSIVELGVWNDSARNAIAVNADAPIDSLDELAENADLFGNRIVGIEPGAGLTGLTQDSVIPTYGLEGMEYLTSSTPAMLSELTAATKAGENIAVTLWEPHWAYSEFPLKNLEDPEGALGAAENITTYAREGLDEDAPQLTEWLSEFKMDLDKLYSLENKLFVENDTDDYGPLVDEWIADNQDWVDGLTD